MRIVEAARQLQEAGRIMSLQGLTWGNAGNLSLRLDDDRFLITASGRRLGELGEEDFVVCRLDGECNGDRKPSKEVPMHRAVYRMRPEAGAVLHGAPFYSTLLACTKEAVPGDLFVEAMYYLERVARVPYHHPGSLALGEAVREAAKDTNVLLLENHGVLAFDVDVQEALQALQVLELSCRMVVTARAGGLELRPLAQEIVKDFLEHSGYRPRRRWPS